jgi:hypothetical protein
MPAYAVAECLKPKPRRSGIDETWRIDDSSRRIVDESAAGRAEEPELRGCCARS